MYRRTRTRTRKCTVLFAQCYRIMNYDIDLALDDVIDAPLSSEKRKCTHSTVTFFGLNRSRHKTQPR